MSHDPSQIILTCWFYTHKHLLIFSLSLYVCMYLWVVEENPHVVHCVFPKSESTIFRCLWVLLYYVFWNVTRACFVSVLAMFLTLSPLPFLSLLQSKRELLNGQGCRSVSAAGQLSTGSEGSFSPQTCRWVHACTIKSISHHTLVRFRI